MTELASLFWRSALAASMYGRMGGECRSSSAPSSTFRSFIGTYFGSSASMSGLGSLSRGLAAPCRRWGRIGGGGASDGVMRCDDFVHAIPHFFSQHSVARELRDPISECVFKRVVELRPVDDIATSRFRFDDRIFRNRLLYGP